MVAEGAVSVEIDVADGRVSGVRVSRTRPVRAAQALGGRTRDEVLRLVPLLFPVCGMAQRVACARAIDAASRRAEDAHVEGARTVVSLAEAAASHLFQLAITWREAAGAPKDAETVRTARAHATEIAAALLGEGGEAPDGDRAVGAADALADLVERLAAEDAALVDAVVRAGRASFGAVPAGAIASARLDVGAIGSRLARDAAFDEHAELDGGPVDATAFASCAGADELSGLGARERAGLLGRLLARRIEARRHAVDLRACVRDLAGAARRDGDVRAAVGADAGAGAGAAETARGRLVHWVRVDGDRVADVRVVAPTDWTFHSSGVLRAALVGAEASPTLARDAGWLVLALDPCVPWKIAVGEVGDA